MDKINEILNDYAEQNIDKLDINLKNVTERDKRIIFNLNKRETIMEDLRLKNLMKRFVNFYENIRSHSSKPEVMNTHISSGTEENHLQLEITFNYKKYQLNPISFPFLQKPNSIFLKNNYLWFHNWFEDTHQFVKECNFGVGVEYNYNKSKQALFFYNSLFFDKNFELDTSFKKYTSNLDIKRKQSTSVIKMALRKNLEERPFIFRDNSTFDNINRFNFEFGNKTINNIIDENSCSTELQYQTPAQDSQFFAKASYEKNDTDFQNFNVANYKFSTGLYKSLNSLFLKNKLFIRKFFFMNDLITYQMNFEAGNIINLNRDSKDLKVHELFLNNNFKGVINPSPKIVMSAGKTGDALGYKNYVMLSNKILLMGLPVFNNFHLIRDGFQVSPFFHFNILLLPDQIGKGQTKSTEIRETKAENNTNANTNANTDTNTDVSIVVNNPFYLSAGFGINFASEALACELYYNAYIKKNSSDIGTEFSFNFGID